MKRFLFLPLAALLLASVTTGCKETPKKQPRVAIAGLAIESSIFSPAVSTEESFKTRYGEEVFSYYPFFHADSGVIDRAEWLPTLRGHAMPGGVVTREAYESLVTQTLDRLKETLPLDGLFFDIHGAMSVQGLDDPEGDFIQRIRDVIGDEVLISTSMDLHGSVTHKLLKHTDLMTCYRLAPHDDAIETKKRAVTNLLDRLESGKGKPAYKAWIAVPVLLPGEKTSTRIEPGKSLYGEIPSLIDKDNVIDASIWMSYPWADQPRNHGVVVTYGDDKEAVGRAAEKLAKHYWDVRKEFDFVAPTVYLDEALEAALKSDKKPFIISDMGDNPTVTIPSSPSCPAPPNLRSLLSKKVMFSLNESNHFLVCVCGVDLRKGLNGLCGIISYQSLIPTSGDVYVFFNKKRTTMKLLHWERGGFVIYYKRLERGRVSHKIFQREEVGFQSYRWDELVLLLEGISPKTKRRKRYNLQ